MSQSTAETAVLQAITGDGALSPYGTAKVQMQDTTAYAAIPIEVASAYDVQQGYEVQRAYHAETGCLINCLRPEVDLFGVK
ncbi:hypothetical protein ACFQJ7_13120 [Halovenus rubra]|uniref:Uncharacterized protein n=2 Tax=Halovenus rubra TaxID=869890 RepID=A0ABD5X6W7_9EURY|nr:hypothetical protein [Halovenus rubra]